MEKKSTFLAELGFLDKVPAVCAFGVILALSSPGCDFGSSYSSYLSLLAWCGLVPLLIVVRGCQKPLEACGISFVFGFTYKLVCLRWLMDPHIAATLVGHNLSNAEIYLLWLATSTNQALLFSVFAWLIWALPTRAGFLPYFKRPFIPYLFAVPAIWAFIYWVIAPYQLFMSMPLTLLAYSQTQSLTMIQLCNVIGAQGLEFLIVLTNTALASLFFELFPDFVKPLPERADILSAVGGAFFDLSMVLMAVLAVNVWGIEKLKNTANELVIAATDKAHFAPFVPIDSALIPFNNTNTQGREDSFSGTKRVNGKVRGRKSKESHTGNLQRNIYICSGAEVVKVIEHNHQPTKNPMLLKSIWGNIGVSTTTDIVYPELIASPVAQGASLLVTGSNLSWSKTNILAKQLLAAAVLRAVENGRYLVIISKEGVCAVINPCGYVISSALGLNTNSPETVQFLYKRTLFTRAWWLWRPFYRIY